MFTDPIGPGTPAWDAFDKAIEAFRAAAIHDIKKDRAYRRYSNQRQYCRLLVLRHGGDWEQWAADLQRHLDNPEDFQ
jgi:hypothetical protein